ncbi:MAG: methyl-accepting chemotaxis receptor/sensory transducer [Rhodospirillaceae bacterium]|nr:MAG: methyl-accepting chemotaxis receptor/sensory transducer [Rhodospirillaceae bacterium]
MTMSLKALISMAVGFLLIAAFASTMFIVHNVNEQQRRIADVKTASHAVGSDSLQLVQEIHTIKYDVAQVQQWLTDVSATRGLDGLDDGPKQAKNFARDLNRVLAAAIRRSDTLGLRSLKDALQQVERSFTPYYDMGQRMAKAYIAFDPEGGNKLMAAFDQTTQTMQDSLNHTNTLTLLETAVEGAVGQMEENLTQIDRQGEVLFRSSLTSGALMTGVVIAVAFVLLRLILAPLGRITATMHRLAGGDHAVALPDLGRHDEIGAMAKAVQVFKDNTIKVARLTAEIEEQKKQAEAEKKKTLNDLSNTFEASVKGVVNGVASAATEMQSTAQSMSAISEETSRQATTVAAAAEQASANVQTVSAAAEELSSSIAEIARQVA